MTDWQIVLLQLLLPPAVVTLFFCGIMVIHLREKRRADRAWREWICYARKRTDDLKERWSPYVGRASSEQRPS